VVTASPHALRTELLVWFAKNQRDLPWRNTDDPYAIWVSEVMLQQTQVDRVVGYWQRFLDALPTVEALAAAPLQRVLTLWRGLGYYSRARNLHLAAKQVVKRFGGKLPADAQALATLPGFGPYTTGAVASIAFGLETPLVDGNVARVLSRVFVVEGSPGDKAREKRLWGLAAELVTGPKPGDLNQALMELGATVCLPSSPLCLLCPLKARCGALKAGRVGELPPPRPATARKRLELAVAVGRKDAQVLLARRRDGGLFGGLWEMPSLEVAPGQPGYPALRTAFGKRATIGPELSVLERTLTHRDLVLRLFPVAVSGRLKAPPEPYVEWRWFALEETRELGMSSAMSTALAWAVPESAES